MAFGLSLKPKNVRIQSILAAVLPLANYLLSVETLYFPSPRLDRSGISLALVVLESGEAAARTQLEENPLERGARYRYMMIRECARAIRLCHSAAAYGRIDVDILALATEANPKAELSFFTDALALIQTGTTPCTTILQPNQRCLSMTYIRDHAKLQERIKKLASKHVRGAGAHLVSHTPVIQNHLFWISNEKEWTKISVYPMLAKLRKNIMVQGGINLSYLPFTNPTEWLSTEHASVDEALDRL